MIPRVRLGSVRLLTVAATAVALAASGTAGAVGAAAGDRVMTPIGVLDVFGPGERLVP